MPKGTIDPAAPIKEASKEVRAIIVEVLKLERERLYEERPRLNSDVVNIVKEVIQ